MSTIRKWLTDKSIDFSPKIIENLWYFKAHTYIHNKWENKPKYEKYKEKKNLLEKRHKLVEVYKNLMKNQLKS